MEIPTVKIQHPDDRKAFVIINAEDFDPEQHKRYEETSPAGDALPEGYSTKHRGGGKYIALVNDQPLKAADSDEPVVFASKAEAEAALVEYAAAQKPAE